jgi:hypothetical protein
MRPVQTEPSVEVLQMVRIANLTDAHDASSRRGSHARVIARVALMVIVAPFAWPWWAVRCWWDLRTEDRQKEAERTLPRYSFTSVCMGQGEARVHVRSAERTIFDPNVPF